MSAVLLAPGLEDGAPVRRFAFGGRVSTEDNQDPDASRNWQISRSRALIEPAGGIIVAEYFDIGQSRSLPWKRRPRAAQDLTSRRGPDSLAGRCYQLGGLVRCGSCGRLLESCWSNGIPVYRCRHGHTSASQPGPLGRRTPTSAKSRSCPASPPWPSSCAAPALASDGQEPGTAPAAVSTAAEVISYLRASSITLTYDPRQRTLRAGTPDAVAVTIDQAG